MDTISPWQPYREPLTRTLRRTIVIALVVGAVLAPEFGGMRQWPLTTLLVLWPSFGGHWVDLFFLNWLRPRISVARSVQITARVAVWFVGGLVIGAGVAATAVALGALSVQRLPAWWIAGLAMIGVELIAHAGLQLRGAPNFYNGRG